MSLTPLGFASAVTLYDNYIDKAVNFNLTVNGVANNGFKVCDLPENMVYLQVFFLADAWTATTGPVLLFYQYNDNTGEYNWLGESKVASTPTGGPPKQMGYAVSFLPGPAVVAPSSSPTTNWTVSGGDLTYSGGIASSGSGAGSNLSPMVKGGVLVFGTNGTLTSGMGQLTVVARLAP